MRSRELIPCPALRPYVRLIWLFELEAPADFGPPERISPDGLLELVFHYRIPFDCRYDGEGFAPQPHAVAVSQTRRFVEIRPRRASGLLSVRFQPWGAYHFLPMPLAELADRQTPAAELWGLVSCPRNTYTSSRALSPPGGVAPPRKTAGIPASECLASRRNDLAIWHSYFWDTTLAAERLAERLAESASDRQRVALVERFLLTRLRRHHKDDVEPLVRAVWRRRGRLRVPGLCHDLGIAERRLQRTFAAALGTTPKGFARLARFLHALHLLRHHPVPSLADVGLACGYYDQSHFNAELKAFSGLTPRQVIAARGLSYLEID